MFVFMFRLSRTERQLPLEVASIHLQEKGSSQLSNSQIQSNLSSILSSSVFASLNELNLVYLETLLVVYKQSVMV